MNNCVNCHKKILLKFIMSIYDIKATDIAKAINVSDSLVRKHIDGIRNCEQVDLYIIHACFGNNFGAIEC